MKVAFLHAVADHKFKYSDINHDFVHMMLESVRRTMPNTDIIHMTDSETPPIPGTITNRLKWEHPNPMIFKMNHMMCIEGDVIILDTDVIVQKDIRPVFNFEFDMALTWRDGPIMTAEGDDIAKVMPYNCGVMFQRSRLFWKRPPIRQGEKGSTCRQESDIITCWPQRWNASALIAGRFCY